jgi:hypothetical protein
MAQKILHNIRPIFVWFSSSSSIENINFDNGGWHILLTLSPSIWLSRPRVVFGKLWHKIFVKTLSFTFCGSSLKLLPAGCPFCARLFSFLFIWFYYFNIIIIHFYILLNIFIKIIVPIEGIVWRKPLIEFYFIGIIVINISMGCTLDSKYLWLIRFNKIHNNNHRNLDIDFWFDAKNW